MNFRSLVLSTLFYRMASLALGIGTSILTYRALGPEQRGVLAYIVFIIGLFPTFANFGIGTSAVYLLGAGKIDIRELKRVIQSIVLVSTIIAWASVFYYFWIHMDEKTTGIYVTIRFPLMGVVFLAILNHLWVSIIYAENRITDMNRAGLAVQATRALIIAAAFFVDHLNLSVAFVAVALSYVVQSTFLLRLAPPVWAFGCRWVSFKSVMSLGMLAYIGMIANYGTYRISYFFITDYLGPAALGIFSLAVLLTERILDITNSTSTVLLPRVSRAGGKESSRERTNLIVRAGLLITLFLCLGIFILSKPLIQLLYGSPYLEASQILIWLLPGIAFLSMGKLVSAHLSGEGKIWTVNWPLLVTLPLYILGLTFALPRYGLTGGAIATSANYIALSSILLVSYLRLTKQSFFTVFRYRKSDFQNLFNFSALRIRF